MSEYLDHAGTMIDVATCTQCGKREVFEEPEELKCSIGDVDDLWRCILEDLEEPNEIIVVCPDCETDKEGFVYVL